MTDVPLPAATPSPTSTDALSDWLRAVADPLRLHIIRLLSQDAFGVQELCQLLDIKQPSLSHHLKILLQARWVTTRRERTTIFYRRDPVDAGAGSLKRRLLDELDAQPLDPVLHARLAEIQQQRSDASRRFFSEQAAQFRDQQALITSVEDYAPLVVRRALAHAGSCLLEVGPAEGDLLPAFAPHFQRLIAVDNSEAMLALTRAQHPTLSHLETWLLDVDQLPLDPPLPVGSVVVMNMVLHHVNNPRRALARLGQALPAEGRLLLTELCAHEQDWAREACGDVWLGFEPDRLLADCQQAGLHLLSSDYLALRNGFRIQIHEFNRAA